MTVNDRMCFIFANSVETSVNNNSGLFGITRIINATEQFSVLRAEMKSFLFRFSGLISYLLWLRA